MMTPEQRKEIADVMEVGFELYGAVQKSLEDDKITVGDSLNFLPVVKELPEAIKGFDTIPDSFKDADDDDRQYFVNLFKGKFDLVDDELETLIEDIFNWVLQTALLVKRAIDAA